MKTIETMDEFNILVEVHVFGRKRFTAAEMLSEAQTVWKEQPRCQVFMMGFDGWMDGDTFHCRQNARGFNRADNDWQVLKKVNESWLYSRRAAFARALWALLGRVHPDESWPDRALRYEPGDYARAALQVVLERATVNSGTYQE